MICIVVAFIVGAIVGFYAACIWMERVKMRCEDEIRQMSETKEG